MHYKLNSDNSVAVAQDYFWKAIDCDTPVNVKIQLLGLSGVAVYGTYDGKDKFFTHWAPLPKRNENEQR